MSDQELALLLGFFKALADESRLKILGILANRECSVEELAESLNLKGPTVSHHLARLKELELVTMRPEGNTHVYTLNPAGIHKLSKDLLTQERIASLAADVSEDAWEKKVLRSFFEGDRLKEIPASRKKRLVILKWLVDQFEEGVNYPEKEINEVIKRHHPDYATLRRELIGNQLMARENGIYWRLPTRE
jgi:hypothetical protein